MHKMTRLLVGKPNIVKKFVGKKFEFVGYCMGGLNIAQRTSMEYEGWKLWTWLILNVQSVVNTQKLFWSVKYWHAFLLCFNEGKNGIFFSNFTFAYRYACIVTFFSVVWKKLDHSLNHFVDGVKYYRALWLGECAYWREPYVQQWNYGPFTGMQARMWVPCALHGQ